MQGYPSSVKGGTAIAAGVVDREQHAARLADPEGYRPGPCRHCGGKLHAPMVAKTDPQLFDAMLDHGLAAAAAPPDLISNDARDIILHVSHGIPRLISHLLRISLVLADERGLASIDVSVVNTAAIVLHLESTRPAVVPPHKPRFDRDSRARG